MGQSHDLEARSTRSARLERSPSWIPRSFRFISIKSSGVFPTRSPIPSTVPWTRSAPASMALRAFPSPKPRSLCPCQSTRVSVPSPRMRSLVKCTKLYTPLGVACPTVSQTQRPSTPSSTAAVNRRRSVPGWERTVSSVTKVFVRPASLHIPRPFGCGPRGGSRPSPPRRGGWGMYRGRSWPRWGHRSSARPR